MTVFYRQRIHRALPQELPYSVSLPVPGPSPHPAATAQIRKVSSEIDIADRQIR